MLFHEDPSTIRVYFDLKYERSEGRADLMPVIVYCCLREPINILVFRLVERVFKHRTFSLQKWENLNWWRFIITVSTRRQFNCFEKYFNNFNHKQNIPVAHAMSKAHGSRVSMQCWIRRSFRLISVEMKEFRLFLLFLFTRARLSLAVC